MRRCSRSTSRRSVVATGSTTVAYEPRWIAERAVGGGLTVLTSGSAGAFPEDCRARFPDAYQAQMDAFARACRGEETDGATLEDDRWAVATAVAARASATRGERLEVGPSWDWNPAVSA